MKEVLLITPQEKRSIKASVFSKIFVLPLGFILSLLATSLTFAHTGVQNFGLIATISSLTALLSFSDLGIGTIVLNTTADAELNKQKLHKVFTKGFYVLCLISLFGILLNSFLSFVLSDFWDVALGHTFNGQQRFILWINMSIFFCAVPFSIANGVLQGLHKNSVVNLFSLCSGVCNLGLIWLCVALHVEPLTYCLTLTTANFITILLKFAYAVKIANEQRIQLLTRQVAFSGLFSEQLLRGSIWAFGISLLSPLMLNSSRLIYSHIANPEQLSEFSILLSIYSNFLAISASFTLPFWPIFISKRKTNDALVLWKKSFVFTFLFSVALALIMLLITPALLPLMTHHSLNVSFAVILLFALALLAQSTTNASSALLNRPQELRYRFLCAALMAVTIIFITYYGYSFIGIASAPLGIFLAFLTWRIVADYFAIQYYLEGQAVL